MEEGRYNFGCHRHIPPLETVIYVSPKRHSSIFGECAYNPDGIWQWAKIGSGYVGGGVQRVLTCEVMKKGFWETNLVKHHDALSEVIQELVYRLTCKPCSVSITEVVKNDEI